MEERRRFYTTVLADHLRKHRQMALVSGPRQVGKTTACRSISDAYLNWDNMDDRRRLLRGPAALAEALQLDLLRAQPPIAVLDELHKYSKWKSLLKGFFDTYGERVRLIVTGSSRINIFRQGSDSLMGRYFFYRMHPWSVAECLRTEIPFHEIQPPAEVSTADWDALWEHGGFPEPFLRRDTRFTRRWRSLRQEQLSREDLREVAQVADLGTMETLVQLLANEVGSNSFTRVLRGKFKFRWIQSSAGSTCLLGCTMDLWFARGSRMLLRLLGKNRNGFCATGVG